ALGARAGRGLDPGAADVSRGRGALADLITVGGELAEGEVVPFGDPMEPVARPRIPIRDGRGRAALDLCVADGCAGVAAQAGQAADGLGEHAPFGGRETHVTVVGLRA